MLNCVHLKQQCYGCTSRVLLLETFFRKLNHNICLEIYKDDNDVTAFILCWVLTAISEYHLLWSRSSGVAQRYVYIWCLIHCDWENSPKESRLTQNYNSCNIDKVYPSEPSNPLRNVLLSLATNNLSVFYFPVSIDSWWWE